MTENEHALVEEVGRQQEEFVIVEVEDPMVNLRNSFKKKGVEYLTAKSEYLPRKIDIEMSSMSV